MSEKPWLILTLRRTGGASLTGFLARISKFRTIEHEPFNDERLYGAVTARFRHHADLDRLSSDMAKALAERPNIKHCFEFLPIEVTEALIHQAHQKGYGILILTRRNEARRQLSLSLAMATGAWGPAQAAEIYPRLMSGELTVPPIDLAALKARVRQDYFALGRVAALLRNLDVAHDWILFEDLYDVPDQLAAKVCAIAARLGIVVEDDDPRLAALACAGGQGSARIGEYIGNFQQAETLLARLCLR